MSFNRGDPFTPLGVPSRIVVVSCLGAVRSRVRRGGGAVVLHFGSFGRDARREAWGGRSPTSETSRPTLTRSASAGSPPLVQVPASRLPATRSCAPPSGLATPRAVSPLGADRGRPTTSKPVHLICALDAPLGRAVSAAHSIGQSTATSSGSARSSGVGPSSGPTPSSAPSRLLRRSRLDASGFDLQTTNRDVCSRDALGAPASSGSTEAGPLCGRGRRRTRRDPEAPTHDPARVWP